MTDESAELLPISRLNLIDISSACSESGTCCLLVTAQRLTDPYESLPLYPKLLGSYIQSCLEVLKSSIDINFQNTFWSSCPMINPTWSASRSNGSCSMCTVLQLQLNSQHKCFRCTLQLRYVSAKASNKQ